MLLPLHPAAGGDLSIPVARVQAALAGSDALFIDMKGEFDALYASYLDEAILLSLAGVAAVLLTLAVVLRQPRRFVTVTLPLVLAVLFVVAGLHLAGRTPSAASDRFVADCRCGLELLPVLRSGRRWAA